jgi:hypothetical protein
MPREYVYGPAWIAAEQNVTGENTDYQLCASVGWSKNGFVQLATIRNGKEDSYDPQDGLYMDLDRKTINDLIRLLRKARNGAFGKDE